MFARLLLPFRLLRRRWAGWSSRDDRAFHDSLFAEQHHDPFSRSYAGYLTIRRFADLAAAHVGDVRTVLDLGCGPGEITCELGRRYPSVTFVGVDHSSAAVERARANSARLQLANVTFVQADLAAYKPDGRVDLVVMFDAFHHLLDPERFVRNAAAFSDRFFLIEPAGDQFGRWRRHLDFDWLPIELDKIRGHIDYALGSDEEEQPAPAAPAVEQPGRAVENRYPREDYERIFDTFHLRIRGTVAGLDVYPPSPRLRSRWRDRVMDTAYDLLREIDGEIQRRGVDLYAKHWAIYATRDQHPSEENVRRGRLPGPRRNDTVQGAFDAAYADVKIPSGLRANTEAIVELTLHNLSWRDWTSEGTAHPIMLSYRWRASDSTFHVREGLRTPLRRTVAAGESCPAAMRVATPAAPGKYDLEIDLVEEGRSWFSAAGVPPLRIAVQINA